MKLYNTLSKRKEAVKPIDGSKVRIYSCGPTVYSAAQIGNMRAYICGDLLVRSLIYTGYGVVRAMNITDVGHLTSDADEGEDKMDIVARREQKSPLEIAQEYEKMFLLDLSLLHIHIPKKILRATQTIPDQIRIIRLLEKKGYTYATSHAVYFNTTKFKKYGMLSGQLLHEKKNLSRGELIEDPQKKHPHDFALWLFTTGKHAHHILRWPSPWGEGFPGWHIECSAISRKLLGQPFDIHTGGIEHIGVHHENEIAQSTCAFGTPLAHLWMHNEHLLVEGKKMGKSLGNAYTLADLQAQKFDPIDFRYFCLQAHYRTILNFTWDGLRAAQTAFSNLRQFIATTYVGKETKQNHSKTARYKKQFDSYISDDIGVPQALGVLWNVVKDISIPLKDRQRLLLEFDAVFGLDLKAFVQRPLPPQIKSLVTRREVFRKNKQFIQSDSLRKEIERLGYELKDSPQGTYLIKKV